jgi:hypothetical protein
MRFQSLDQSIPQSACRTAHVSPPAVQGCTEVWILVIEVHDTCKLANVRKSCLAASIRRLRPIATCGTTSPNHYKGQLHGLESYDAISQSFLRDISLHLSTILVLVGISIPLPPMIFKAQGWLDLLGSCLTESFFKRPGAVPCWVSYLAAAHGIASHRSRTHLNEVFPSTSLCLRLAFAILLNRFAFRFIAFNAQATVDQY